MFKFVPDKFVIPTESPNKKAPPKKVRLFYLVETAGIEPASASPLPLALHAYSDFVLTGCYPPDGEDKQLARYLFSALAPNKPPSRFYESDAGMFRVPEGIKNLDA